MIYLIVLVLEIYFNWIVKVFNLKRIKKFGVFFGFYKDILILKMF